VLEEEPDLRLSENKPPLPELKKVITPSLATLERAVSARDIHRKPLLSSASPTHSREQRRMVMEKDMLSMGLSEARKEDLRARWRQNETDYQRRKVDVSAFIKSSVTVR